MKFAKELEDDLVPEWRVKYFNYKVGKKRIKAVTKALRQTNRTSPNITRPSPQKITSSDPLPFTFYDFTRRNDAQHQAHTEMLTSPRGENETARSQAKRPESPEVMRRQSVTMFARSPPILMPETAPVSQSVSNVPTEPASPDTLERTPLHQQTNTNGQQPRRYGSIPREDSALKKPTEMPDLELPDPALDPRKRRPSSTMKQTSLPVAPSVPAGDAQQDESSDPAASKANKSTHFSKDMFTKALAKQPGNRFSKNKLKTMFRSQPLDPQSVPEVTIDAANELDARQKDFFDFLDKELKKIEKFYKTKEEEATGRLELLRAQLHEMRDRVQQSKINGQPLEQGFMDSEPTISSLSDLKKESVAHKVLAPNVIKPLKGIMKSGEHGKNSKSSRAMQKLSSPPSSQMHSPAANGDRSDYVRKKTNEEHVPYRFARRRLKLALQEFYRGMELLKSYALLNRTAFRKINKKYDKAVNARPTLAYMSSKVNDAHFVQSNVIEGHLVAVEDLYARYFERGNHKVAVNKLRSRLRQGDQSSVAFRNGFYVAAGTGFAVAGLVSAGPNLFTDDLVLKTQTSYLLQIYGGYFLALLLFLFFVLDCRIWTRARVNYVFVFEFDTRHVLDWRQLAELPCFLLFLNGLFVWLNFEFDSAHPMYLYWPVILIGLTLVIIAFPAKVLYYHSRKWFGVSNWRLLLAGIYPVEFRDFFFGDMYCSETYAMSQIELFFCLYANGWNNPAQCNSNHSMLLGFFTALPAVWRANQCLRRYYDTRAWFPHLANFLKYLLNITYYMTLSLYRLHLTRERQIVFIVFAAINGLYSSVWDVFMDWSLGNPFARHSFLRNNLAYRRIWYYYAAIVTDVVLRHQWILYAIFTADLQHSAFMSFAVGLAEVIRRGIWSLFRVENEHCNNVKKFRASRDVPLPYAIDKKSDHVRRKQRHSMDAEDTETDDQEFAHTPASPRAPGSGVGTAVDLERQTTWDSLWSAASSLRQRKTPTTPGLRALQRVGTVIAAAHAQDFTKKRREDVVGQIADDETPEYSSDDDDHDDMDDEDEDDDMDNYRAPARTDTRDFNPTSNNSSNARTTGAQAQNANVQRTYGTSTSTLNTSQAASQRMRRARGEPSTENTHLSIPASTRQDHTARNNNRNAADTGSNSTPSSSSTAHSETDPAQQRQADADEQDEADIIEARERIDRARSQN